VDQSQVDAGQAAFEGYLAAETDVARKTTAQKGLAQMLFDANSFEKALAEYQKILATNPDDTDALVKSGMLLFNIGAINNDKAKYQEAANFLQQFVDKAPDTDRLKPNSPGGVSQNKLSSDFPARPCANKTVSRKDAKGAKTQRTNRSGLCVFAPFASLRELLAEKTRF
ncbi:MAG: hypothetical protein ABR568_24125, partial [Pyrinomonadaceae bacterium]